MVGTAADPIGRFVAGLAARLLGDAGGQLVGRVHDLVAGQPLPGERRASLLTGRGIPFEASVSGPAVRPALRYVAEVASDRAFFVPRLAHQRAVASTLAGLLPAAAAERAVATVESFFDAYAPDPAGVPARVKASTFVGVVHDPARPEHLDRVKVYGHVDVEPDCAGRMLAAWPDIANATDDLLGLDGLEPSMAATDVDADGRVTRKLYFRTARRFEPAVGVALAERLGAGGAGLLGELGGLGLGDFWSRKLFVCRSIDDSAAVMTSLHGSAAAAGTSRAEIEPVVRALARRVHGHHEFVDALVAAADGCGVPWSFTVLGLGVGSESADVPKLNVYAAPDRLA